MSSIEYTCDGFDWASDTSIDMELVCEEGDTAHRLRIITLRSTRLLRELRPSDSTGLYVGD